MNVSFSKRLLLLFILCSTLPLFLLSFVFSEISSYVVARNALRSARNISQNVLTEIEKTTEWAERFANELSKNDKVIEWCQGKDDAAIVSDLFQNIAKNTDDDIFQVYIVSSMQEARTISRQTVPQEYKSDIYSDWGILHKTVTEEEPLFLHSRILKASQML